jgi:hypothetical protein
VGGDALLDGLGEVLPQVEPVGDLDRLRCPGPGAVRERARPVTADHLDAGVRGQPVRERPGVAALEEVERRAGLAVNQQRAVVLAAPDREVIDPEDPRAGRLRVRDGHDQPQHDRPARRSAQPGGKPRSRPARQRHRDAPQHPSQQRGLPRVADRQSVDLLGERPAPAAGSRAEEPADGQQDLHLAPADRGVGQPPGIAAVDPARHRPALRAGRFGGTRPGHHEQQAGRHGDLLNDHPGPMRQENPQLNGTRA